MLTQINIAKSTLQTTKIYIYVFINNIYEYETQDSGPLEQSGYDRLSSECPQYIEQEKIFKKTIL